MLSLAFSKLLHYEDEEHGDCFAIALIIVYTEVTIAWWAELNN